jgi:hypothetical protein
MLELVPTFCGADVVPNNLTFTVDAHQVYIYYPQTYFLAVALAISRDAHKKK